MPTTAPQARSHHARQAAIAAAAVLAVRRMLARWPGWGQFLETVASYQYASALTASQTMAGLAGTAPLVDPAPFAGVSSAGFPIYEPIVATIDQIIPAPVEALPAAWWTDANEFMDALVQLIESEIQDAGRSAAGAEIASHDEWQNYVRLLTPPSCKRCVVLAGRIYRDLEGFERHPQCFPAGTVVSGPASLAATRRWYEGELVILRTADGQELSATANHPVLTDQGWVPANRLYVGDYVVRSTRPKGALPLVVPDEQQAPALIEDVRGSDGMVPFGEVPSAAEDFHGDGRNGEVDVVLADRLLWGGLHPAGPQFGHEEQLARRIAQPLTFAGLGSGQQLPRGVRDATHGIMRSSSLGGALFGSHATRTHLSGLGHVTDRHTFGLQSEADDVARDGVTQAERVLALAGLVRRRDVGRRKSLDAPRWDAPAGPLTEQNRAAYASRGLDLGHRIAGQVARDRLVEVRRVSWSGHVYNLTSAEGWFSANGLIVSNCDCVHWPVQDWDEAHDLGLVSSPREAFDRGLIRDLTEGERQAIEDGADIGKVINSSSGIFTADLFGRRVKATRYGTTRRAAWRRANPTLLLRLRPESIYKIANGDRAEALRLLRLYGYLTS